MAEEKIGIKLADGSFYPILESEEPKKRRVVLTTASNEQDRAQIDLYRGSGTEDATYVGSVVLNELASNGDDREIELVVGLDDEGTVSARATESSTGNYQSLSVTLDTVGDEDRLELPDFDEDLGDDFQESDDESDDLDLPDFDEDLGDDFEEGDIDFEGLDDDSLDLGEDEFTGEEALRPSQTEEPPEEEALFDEEEEESSEPRRFSPIAITIFLLVSLAILAALTYGVFKLLESDPIPPLEAYLPPLLLFPKAPFRFLKRRSGAD